MTRLVAFLRGINVGGHNLVPMKELRAIAASLRCDDVVTYIQSGNLIFSHAGAATPEAIAVKLRAALIKRCAIDVPLIVLPAARFTDLVTTQPFGTVPDDRAKFVHLGLTQAAVAKSAQAALQARAQGGERVVVVRGACGSTTARGSPRAS